MSVAETVPVKASASLSTLPAELQLAIISCLDPVSSTCLGLTCKTFYPIHIALHGVVYLGTNYWGWYGICGKRFAEHYHLTSLSSKWGGPMFERYHYRKKKWKWVFWLLVAIREARFVPTDCEENE